MRGELIGVWSETWREVWVPLIDQPLGEEDQGIPDDIFCELYRALAPALSPRLTVEDLADIIDNPVQSREAFEATTPGDIAGECALVGFFEAAHDALEELGGDELTNRYFNLLSGFIDKFSLRYDLRRPCILCPTLPGIFTSLVRELDTLSITDQNMAKRLRDFKESVQDLRLGPTEGRVANCVMKQVMFLEAVAAASGKVAGSDLAALCKALEHWPHPAVRQSLLNLYGFASDFPGVRHGTPSAGMKRDIDMRDLVAMSILLTGFAPYLESRLSADAIFGGSVIHAGPILQVPVVAPDPAGASNDATKLIGFLNRLAFWRRER
jgi:hypothetical protein